MKSRDESSQGPNPDSGAARGHGNGGNDRPVKERREFLTMAGKVILVGEALSSVGPMGQGPIARAGDPGSGDGGRADCSQSDNVCEVRNVCSGTGANVCGPDAQNICTGLNACTGWTESNVCEAGTESSNVCGSPSGGHNQCNSAVEGVNTCTGGDEGAPANYCTGPGGDGYGANACAFTEEINANSCDPGHNWCEISPYTGNVAFEHKQISCHPETDT